MTKRMIALLFLIAATGVVAARLSGSLTSDGARAEAEANPNDCCIEAVEWNFTPAPISARGNHCPAARVPQGSEDSFDPEQGRIEIYFMDAAHGESGVFVLDVNDPACFEFPATRRAIFGELAMQLQPDTSDAGFWAGCERLREAIKKGSMKVGEKPYDLRPAQPFVAEVCTS